MNNDTDSDLKQRIDFILEIDKAKQIVRRSYLSDASRLENDAEHGWHIAVMALVLETYAQGPVDIAKVIRMLLIHDLVEIDAGDTYAYDEAGNRDKLERETKAAERIFALLPATQGSHIRSLWDEFEAGRTREAKYAGAMDKLQPLLLNYYSGGRSWLEHGIGQAQVKERLRSIADGAPELWRFAEELIDQGVRNGRLKP